MARREKQKQSNSTKGLSQCGAFEYRLGSQIATVKHFNIKKASLAKREKAANELKVLGIKKVLANGHYFNVRKFLNLGSDQISSTIVYGGYVPGKLPARLTHKPLKFETEL